MPYFTDADVPDSDDLRQCSFELCAFLDDVDGMKSLLAEGVDLNRNCAEYSDGNVLVRIAD